jgi:hypothetical protein
MSAENRKWLEEALKAYTFNDVDKMKEVCDELKHHLKMNKDNLLYLLEEALELVELHPRNALNLCTSGGMQVILDIIFNNQIDEVRSSACTIFSFCV